ncbi:DUF6325 family protein [Microbacterium sp. Leaf320]|uniref:DUF6325 family protein n=1 Tax=Microbacterium sp. Leaf320 TaxID=1736334 RepID=UPI0006FE44A8|nr:DUF6325 family protein [Microbacterium sp. Leaf320]KQQ65342.1 hypothetical protein ASF63_15485 [Microbacterium sp. Leaf320]
MSIARTHHLSDIGPLELFIVRFEGTAPDPDVIGALHDLADYGTVRLVDLLIAVRDSSGHVHVSELADIDPRLAARTPLIADGLIGDDDARTAAADIPPGSGVALAALEMRWASALSSAVAAAGGRVVHVALIPAPTVHELIQAGLATTTTPEEN